MSATASGADTKSNGVPKSREHNQGNQGRKYTIEQKAAVIRVRKCAHTAFYEILGVEKAASDGDIKKAYRKLSLLTHPDKNGYDGADEAFKMVSRAFQILSDEDKKAKFDRFGGDPDNRFSSSAQPSSPFSGFARSPGGGGPMFEEEISPEELFQRFFGGGGVGGPFGQFGGDMFGGGGSQFVFNLGGGPGFRVHQFGGGRPRRRPREANRERDEQPQSLSSILMNLLPLLILVILPLLSSLMSSGDSSSGPEVRLSPGQPYTMKRTTLEHKINYYVNPQSVVDYNPRKFHHLDLRVEREYISNLRYECSVEMQTQNRLIQEAQGWFFPDENKMREARNMEKKSCSRLIKMGEVGGY